MGIPVPFIGIRQEENGAHITNFDIQGLNN